MKTKLTLIFILCIATKVCYSQTSTWNLSGNGGTNPATDFVGTTDPNDLSFRTNNTIKMQLESTGELGLGTTTPASWLHILTKSGSTNEDEPFRTAVPSGVESNWRMLRGSSSMMRLWNPGGGNDIFLQTPQGGLKIGTGTGTIIEALHVVGGSGANKGYVGIGDYSVFTPNRKLDVYDPTGPQFRLSYNAGSSGSPAVSTIYSDFQTLSTGDLYIDPINNTTPKGVCIGTTTVTDDAKLSVSANTPSSASSVSAVNIKSVQGSGVTGNKGIDIIVDGGITNAGLSIVQQNATGGGIGINVSNTNNPTFFGNSVGIVTSVSGRGYNNIALNSIAANSTGYNYGIITGAGNNAQDATLNYGIQAIALGGKESYGVYALALNGSTYTYGIYSSGTNTLCAGGGGQPGCASAAGYFNGDLASTAALFVTSDQKLKKNILDAPSTMSLINSLQLKTFDYDSIGYPSMNLPQGNHYGLIAQDVEQILPNLVKNLGQPAIRDTLGNIIIPAVDFKGLNYIEFIPIMLKAMQEQNTIINQQQLTLDSLINVLGGVPRPNNNINPNSQRIELSDNQGIIINQNDPNPWSESTTITYSIPTSVKDARIMFTDNRGTVLRSAKIESRGEGSLDVYASELSSGIYTYTLICDGKVIESKKMMKM